MRQNSVNYEQLFKDYVQSFCQLRANYARHFSAMCYIFFLLKTECLLY